MKKTIFIFALPFIIAIIASCDSARNNLLDTNTLEGKIEQRFSDWAKDNVSEKYQIQSISYDKSKTPLDYIYVGTMLSETVGSSGKTKQEVETGTTLIMLESIIDSTYLNTPLSVAKIDVYFNNNTYCYYMGLRGDSICTGPLLHGYEALKMIHKEGEQIIYDACQEISINCILYAKSLGATSNSNMNSNEEYYNCWIKHPTYEEAIQAIGNK